MENITVYIKNQSFYIESIDFEFTNLRIENNNQVLPFENEAPNCWKISIDNVTELLEPNQESRAFIYYGESKKQISSDDFNIIAQGQLFLETNIHPIYLYFSLDNKLRFMWHQVPSARGYYLSSKAIVSSEGAPHLKLEVQTKHLSLKTIDFIMVNRDTKEQIIFPITINKTSLKTDNTFLNTFLFNFDEQILSTSFFKKINLYHYEVTIVDFFIRIKSDLLPLTDYRFRLASPLEKPIEIYSPYKKESAFIGHFYVTPLGNLSARYNMIPYETSQVYLDAAPTKQSEKPIVLLFEYPYKAQDNALAFFNYLMKKDTFFDVYYVIEKESSDFKNLANYSERIVEFRSPEHVKLFFKASYLISSHTPSYGMPLFSSKTIEKRNDAHTIFLQHGIIAYRNLEPLYGKKTNPDLIDTFIVSSQREKDLVHTELFYPNSAIKITGLARFDRLLKNTTFWHSYRRRKRILIMPSWRKGQEHLSEEAFKETAYFKEFQALLTNELFQESIEKLGLKVSFYLHNNFQKYRHLFYAPGINILNSESKTIQDLMKEHGIMVTDFSSVGLDFALQKRPVFYYQFEEDISDQRAFEKISSFLPGPVYTNSDELVLAILQKTRKNTISKEYRQLLKKNLYTHMDTHSCERIYQVLRDIDSQN